VYLPGLITKPRVPIVPDAERIVRRIRVDRDRHRLGLSWFHENLLKADQTLGWLSLDWNPEIHMHHLWAGRRAGIRDNLPVTVTGAFAPCGAFTDTSVMSNVV
jgi:hypothetical protein